MTSNISNTLFDLLPEELTALCIPVESPKDFLSLFKNPKVLFKKWLSVNYPGYIHILKYDKSSDSNKSAYTKLFTLFKDGYFPRIKLNGWDYYFQRKFDIIYPILVIREYPELYHQILEKNILEIKSYKDMFKNIIDMLINIRGIDGIDAFYM